MDKKEKLVLKRYAVWHTKLKGDCTCDPCSHCNPDNHQPKACVHCTPCGSCGIDN